MADTAKQQSQTTVVDDGKLKEIQDIAKKKLENTSIVPVDLEKTERKEIDDTFHNVKDFRQLGERITAPIDNIVERTAKIIDGDPVMDVSKELADVNKHVQKVYREIIDDDGPVMKFLKSIPLVGGVVDKLDDSIDDAKFNMKKVGGKIEIIFEGFDIAYNSLNTSIDMQKDFLDGLEANLGKVESYKDYVAQKLEEFKAQVDKQKDEAEREKYKMFVKNVEYFLANLEVLLGNLELARKRLLVRLDSAVKLSLAMNSSRPIFKTLISVAVIEISGQKALDASMKAIDVMGNTIDSMSKDLTDKAIESSRKAEEMSTKPILDTQVFVDNVKKLKEHFDTMDQFRATIKTEAEEERKLFAQASKDLKKIQDVQHKDYDELADELREPDRGE